MNTCIAEGCPKDIEVKKHGLCRSHYNKLYYHGLLPEPRGEVNCKTCGAVIVDNGRHRVYCTAECRTIANRTSSKEASRAKRRAERMARAPRPCSWCSRPLDAGAPGQQRFHKDCARQWSNAQDRDNYTMTCSADGCDRPTRARGMCSMHWKRWARDQGMIKPDPWNERRKITYQRRRALIKGATRIENVTIDALMKRDGNTCGICEGRIDESLAWPDPMSKSIDHVLALSKGGQHTFDNTAPAHLVCNIRKSDKGIDEVRAQHG